MSVSPLPDFGLVIKATVITDSDGGQLLVENCGDGSFLLTANDPAGVVVSRDNLKRLIDALTDNNH